MRTIILTLICHYSGMNGKVVFLIPFLLDQEVILLRQSLLMDQVPVFLPMEPRLALYGRPQLRGHDVIVIYFMSIYHPSQVFPLSLESIHAHACSPCAATAADSGAVVVARCKS